MIHGAFKAFVVIQRWIQVSCLGGLSHVYGQRFWSSILVFRAFHVSYTSSHESSRLPKSTHGMRLRAALTSLLAAIQLCVSCSASACALNCELNGLRLTVHASDERGSSVEKAVPDHCGHVAGSRENRRIAKVGQGTQIGQQCGSGVCCHGQADVVSNSGYLLCPSEPSAAVIVRGC